MAHQHEWISTHCNGYLPPNAVRAGQDADGDPIYLGRAFHNGDMLPCKYVPNKGNAYVAWGGDEIVKHEFEILTGEHHYTWLHGSHGHVPAGAVRVGHTSDGEAIYAGRGHIHGSLTPGKVHPSHKCLYVPFGGREHRLESYEVLCEIERWERTHGSHILPGTIHAGTDVDGDAIYVGRAFHEGDLLPAKVIPSKNCAYVSYGGEEIVKHEFEVLVGHGYGWVPASDGYVPPGSVVCGRTSDGEPLYVGRGHYSGSFTPGKIHRSHNCLYIPFGGREVSLNSYEVLVKA